MKFADVMFALLIFGVAIWWISNGLRHIQTREARGSILYISGIRYYYLTRRDAVIFGCCKLMAGMAFLAGFLLSIFKISSDLGLLMLVCGVVIFMIGNAFFSCNRGEWFSG